MITEVYNCDRMAMHRKREFLIEKQLHLKIS